MSQLVPIADALREGRSEDALRAAISVWHAVPDPDLARLCAALGATIPADAPDDPWGAEKRATGSVDVGVLCGALLPAATSAQLLQRVETLVARPVDPRIGVAIEGLLRAVPFTSNGARGNLATIFDAVGRLAFRDPRFVGLVATLDTDWDVRPAQKEWMFKRWAKVQEAIDRHWPTVPRVDDRSTLAELLASLEDEPAAPDTVDDLIARVLADPHEDAPRLVLLDALLEAQDPRGELMALQLRGVDRERQDALIAEHGTTWLGDIAPFVRVTRWRLGFPDAGEVEVRHPRDLTRIATHPLWRAFSEIQVDGDKVDVLGPLFDHVAPTLRGLGSFGPLLAGMVPGRPWPALRRLEVRVTARLAAEALAAHPLPALQVLSVFGDDLTWLSQAVWLPHLRTLRIPRGGVDRLTTLWPVLAELPGLETASCARATLRRGTDGRMTHLELHGPTQLRSDPDLEYGRSRLPAALEALPDGALTELTVTGDAPSGWPEQAQALLDRSTRLRHASLVGMQVAYARDGVLELTRPLPALRKPTLVAVGADGTFVAQDNDILRVDPATAEVLEAIEAGSVGVLTAGGPGELAWNGGGSTTWRDRFQHAGYPRFLRFGPPGLMLAGHGVEILAADGSVVTAHKVGNLVFHAGAFAPDGERYAVVGWQTRLRILSVSGGKPKMLGTSKQTKAVAWTEAGIWLAAHELPLQLLGEKGEVLREVDCAPFDLRAWQGGVVACDGKEAVVVDAQGGEVYRTPAWRAWPTDAGLVVQTAEAPWLHLHAWSVTRGG